MSEHPKRSLLLSTSPTQPVSIEQLNCFVRGLTADAQRAKPSIKWKPESNNGFQTNGLTPGSLIKISTCCHDGKPAFRLAYSRDGEQVVHAIETDGTPCKDSHLACLHRTVESAVKKAALYGTSMPEETAVSRKASESKSDPYCMRVGDVLRAIDIDELVSKLLDQPSMLNLSITKNSPEWTRKEALIRSIATYLQSVAPRETGVLLDSWALKTPDGFVCGHLVTTPMARVANAHVQIDDKHYGGLTPKEANLKFAADIIANLMVGV